ncbi:hypothetical protein [Limnoglobus roseus]|uniref:Uncharacterized protein n=1 Tax=Limnoglobus roseus TaxID=2598579 RepID=A0A5C1AK46_9BACT|nr:hypothetical protein [Limnoglobus roseus]QEL17288.1 hypothetical protein PX52LOC_04271 [Limnoglobus roseus]
MAEVTEIVRALRTGTADDKNRAIREIHRLKVNDDEVTTLLAGLLLSREVSDRDGSVSNAEHQAVAWDAMAALQELNLFNDTVAHAVFVLLARPSDNWSFPQASFDQGMYIGDYGEEVVWPAVLGCRLAATVVAARPDWRERLLTALGTAEQVSEVYYAAQGAKKRIAALTS